MIAYLKGTISYIGEGFAVLMAGPVGYRVGLSASALKTLHVGMETELHTHHHVREDAQELFGFTSREQLEFFEQLISISGIGPKTALNILSETEVETLKQAIVKKDLLFLTKISGIGKKTAERMILELEGKLLSSLAGGQFQPTSNADVEVIEALISLGYSQEQARRAIKDVTEVIGTDAKLKAALKHLSK